MVEEQCRAASRSQVPTRGSVPQRSFALYPSPRLVSARLTSISGRSDSMDADDFSGLNISRYQLRLRARKPVTLPRYLGSTLRGAFGHALKEAVCVVGHRDCDRCI